MYSAATARKPTSQTLNAKQRVTIGARNLPYLAIDKFKNSATNLGLDVDKLSVGAKNRLQERSRWTRRLRNEDNAVLVRSGRTASDVVVNSVPVEHFAGGDDKQCTNAWTVVTNNQVDIMEPVTNFLCRKGLCVVQRNTTGSVLRYPPKFEDNRPLVFTPEGEFAGTWHDVKSHLHFGSVVYNFAPGSCTYGEQKAIRSIIQQYLGIGNPFISWCTFTEKDGTGHDEDVLYLDIHMRNNNVLLNDPDFAHRPDLNGMSITSNG